MQTSVMLVSLSGLGFVILLFPAIVVLQNLWATTTSSSEISIGYDHQYMHSHHSSSHSNWDPNDPELKIFLRANDLKLGQKMPFCFPIRPKSRSPLLLSREEAESIPFSSSQLPKIFELLSIPDGSPQAEAMEATLSHCEFEPRKGESKFCATSLESLFDSTSAIFGPNVGIKVGTTKHLSENSTSLLQNYTVLENPKMIPARRIVGCHLMPYPYAVYYCHSQESDNKLLKLSFVGDNGWRVEALGFVTWILHNGHLIMSLFLCSTLGLENLLCHIFPADNLVWYPSAYESM